MFLFIVSYLFYAGWDYRFVALLFISSITDYFVGLRLGKSEDPSIRKRWLYVSVFINLGMLGIFKYYNFFVASFVDFTRWFGMEPNIPLLQIALPIGISFYTFQTLSYTIDIYRKQLEPTRDIVAFFAFVSFFPQLVIGPIERAKNMLPQFFKPRQFDRVLFYDGTKQILWGFFKKVVVADGCAQVVDVIFTNYTDLSGLLLVCGIFIFYIQVYCDFSGYSDIAIGLAALFGFRLKQNFIFPLFSRNLGEFWRRWHISQTTWFRDYVYIPLGGNRGGKNMVIRNSCIVFVVSGFWHGANWTYIIWGAYHALVFIPVIYFDKNRIFMNVVAENAALPTLKECRQMLTTFFIVGLPLVFFRSPSFTETLHYIQNIFTPGFWALDFPFKYSLISKVDGLMLMTFVVIMFIFEWINRKHIHGLSTSFTNKYARWVWYGFLTLLILAYFGEEQPFIYFQF